MSSWSTPWSENPLAASTPTTLKGRLRSRIVLPNRIAVRKEIVFESSGTMTQTLPIAAHVLVGRTSALAKRPLADRQVVPGSPPGSGSPNSGRWPAPARCPGSRGWTTITSRTSAFIASASPIVKRPAPP